MAYIRASRGPLPFAGIAQNEGTYGNTAEAATTRDTYFGRPNRLDNVCDSAFMQDEANQYYNVITVGAWLRNA